MMEEVKMYVRESDRVDAPAHTHTHLVDVAPFPQLPPEA